MTAATTTPELKHLRALAKIEAYITYCLKLGRHFQCTNSHMLLQVTVIHLPVGTVWMAEVADVTGICVLPDQGVVLPQDPSWAGLDTVWAINVVGTFDAVVWPLNQGTVKVMDFSFPF